MPDIPDYSSIKIRDIEDAAAHEEKIYFNSIVCLKEMQLLENMQSAKPLAVCQTSK